MVKCKKNFLYINSSFGLVHKIKTLSFFLIFWFFWIFFEVEDNLVFEQFFWLHGVPRIYLLRVIKVWNIVFDEEGVRFLLLFFLIFFLFVFSWIFLSKLSMTSLSWYFFCCWMEQNYRSWGEGIILKKKSKVWNMIRVSHYYFTLQKLN